MSISKPLLAHCEYPTHDFDLKPVITAFQIHSRVLIFQLYLLTYPYPSPEKQKSVKMKHSVLTTLLALAAISLAVAVPHDDPSTLAKKSNGIIVTLCNDFHGGKPCETHNVKPRQCSKFLFL